MTAIYPPGQARDNESDQKITLEITVNTYGNAECALQSVLLNMGRALHHAFGDSFEMRNLEGTHIVYDSFAHDGEHVGHDEALKFRSDILRLERG